ncbi:unnamed protein product, partial [Closterium sp. NIES-53]
TSPTLRWTGEFGDALAFRVWGALSLVRDTTAGKLSSCTLRCVFLGFPTDTPPWQFYHPASHRVLSSQDVSFDKSVCFYRLHPHASSLVPPLPLFPVPGPPSPHRVLLPQGGDHAVDDTVSTRRSPRLETPLGLPPLQSSLPPQPVAVDSGVAGGGDTGGADSRGAGPGVPDSRGVESRGAGSGQQQSRQQETLSPQQLRDWIVRRGRSGPGAWSTNAGGAGGAGAGGAGAGGARDTGAGGAGGTGAAGAGGTRATAARGAGAGGAGGIGAAGAGGAGAGGARGAGAGGSGGTGAGGTGATGARGARAGGFGGIGAGGAGAGGAGAGGSGTMGIAPR